MAPTGDHLFSLLDYQLEGRYPKAAVWHPADEAARIVLENRLTESPVLKGPVSKLIVWMEEGTYLINLADNKRITPESEPLLHRSYEQVCARLGVTPVNLFLDMDPQPNAYAIGGENASIVITQGLVDLLDPAEIEWTLAHELGHVLSNHTRYGVLALQIRMVRQILELIPAIGPGLGLVVAMNILYWNRRAEFTADRYGALGVEDPSVASGALAKIAGGGVHTDTAPSVAELRSQADEFRVLAQALGPYRTGLDLFFGFRKEGIFNSHPWPAIRIWELERWLESRQFQLLKAGRFADAEAARFDVEMFFGVDVKDGKVQAPAEVVMSDLVGELSCGAIQAAARAKEKVTKGLDRFKTWLSEDDEEGKK